MDKDDLFKIVVAEVEGEIKGIEFLLSNNCCKDKKKKMDRLARLEHIEELIWWQHGEISKLKGV